MSTAVAARPRTLERRVRGVVILYTAEEVRGDGTIVETCQKALRGQLITAPVTEIARLDALGALAPPGATEQDLADDLEASQAQYRAARSGVTGNGEVF